MPLSGAVGPGFRLHGAMLSLLRLPHIRPMHDENSRNHALSVVAMLISPMLFIFLSAGASRCQNLLRPTRLSYLPAETRWRARI